MDYFSEFFGLMFGGGLLLYLALILIDGVCGLRDFFSYSGKGVLTRGRGSRKWL